MARIAKKPIEIPQGVKIKPEGNKLTVEGPKGSLSLELMPGIKVESKDRSLLVSPFEAENVDGKASNANHGLTHALIKNMILGVTTGFEKRLEIQGVGYRANMEKGKLSMSLGFSHPVVIELPK